MTIKQQVSRPLRAGLEALPFPLLQRFGGGGLFAPIYHGVSDETPAHIRALYRFRTVAEFERDLDYFQGRFTPVTLRELLAHQQGGDPLPRHALFLSFDDGLREVADVVVPILKRRGFPAAFFLVTAWLGNRALFYRHAASVLVDHVAKLPPDERVRVEASWSAICPELASGGPAPIPLRVRYAERSVLSKLAEAAGVDLSGYLQGARPYLRDADVARLIADGFGVGGHSVDHPPFADIDDVERLRQTSECVRELRAKFGVPCQSFALPFSTDGADDGYLDRARREADVRLFFGVGASAWARGNRFIDRFSMEAPRGLSAPANLARIAARRIIST